MLEPDFDPQPTAVQIGHAGIHARAGRRDAPGAARSSFSERLMPRAGRFGK